MPYGSSGSGYGPGGGSGTGGGNPIQHNWGGGTSSKFGGMFGNPEGGGGTGYTYLNQGGGGGPNQYSTTGNNWSQVNDPTAGEGVTKYFNSATGEYYYDRPKNYGYRGGQGSQPTQYGATGTTGPAGDPYAWVGQVQGPQMPGFNKWEGGGYEGPAGWVPPSSDIPEAGVDTRAIVESRRHQLDEEMSGQMSDSARRMGAGGMLAGSEYVNELGQAERGRDKDLAGLYYQYDYDAAQQDATRKSAARENMLNRDLSSWGTKGGWEQEAAMMAGNQEFQAWAAENGFNQANYDNELDYMNSIMPLLMAGGGAGGAAYYGPGGAGYGSGGGGGGAGWANSPGGWNGVGGGWE